MSYVSYVFIYDIKHVSNMWSIWPDDMKCMLHDQHARHDPSRDTHFRGLDLWFLR